MIGIVYGDEPYGIQKIISGFLEKSGGMVERFDAFDSRVIAAASRIPLLTSRNYLLVELDRQAKLGDEFFQYAACEVEMTEILIVLKSYDEKSKLFTKLKELDTVHLAPKYRIRGQELSAFIQKRAQMLGKTMADDAVSLYMERTSYGEDGSSLFQVCYDIENLCDSVQGDVVTRDVVDSFMADTVDGNSFSFVSALAKRNWGLAYQLADVLSRGSVIGALMALERELRLSYKRTLQFSVKEIGGFKEPGFSKCGMDVLLQLLPIPCDYALGIKKGLYDERSVLKSLTHNFKDIMEVR